MNYIAEINGFYNWLVINPLPANAQALWHILMQINNKSAVLIDGRWYWRAEFTIPNERLSSILSFSRQQLDRMRNVLIQTGRIVYKKGKGNKSGKYSIIPLNAQYVTQYVTHIDTQDVHKAIIRRTQVWIAV